MSWLTAAQIREGKTLAMPGRDKMLAKVTSQLGYREEAGGASKYGRWFAAMHGSQYVTGDWCAMGLLWSANESGQLEALGGARKEWAWVPSWWAHFRGKGQTGRTAKRGAIVFFDFNNSGDPEHVGICTGTSSGTVNTIEFNTSNQCLRRRRNSSDILGYAYPDYSSGDDDMPTYVSVNKDDKSRKEELKPGQWQEVNFNVNNGSGTDKHHAKGDYPSLVRGAAYYSGHITLQLSGLPAGVEGQVRPVEVAKQGDNWTVVETESPLEFTSSDGETYARLPITGSVAANQRLRVEVRHLGENLTATVTGGHARILVWER